MQALVDTGSTVSLIEDVATGNVVKINNNITLKTAGKGDGLFSSSKVKQQFVIGNKIFEHEFLVVKSITYKINSTFAWCEPVTLTERIAALSVCADHDQRVQHLVAALTPPECLPFMRDIADTYASAFVDETVSLLASLRSCPSA